MAEYALKEVYTTREVVSHTQLMEAPNTYIKIAHETCKNACMNVLRQLLDGGYTLMGVRLISSEARMHTTMMDEEHIVEYGLFYSVIED